MLEVRMPNNGALPADRRVLKALEIMSAHFQEPLDTNSLSSQVGLSPSHFSRLFRLQTGSSPHTTLRLKRLREAAVLLVSTFLAVKEVAFAVGYRDVSHFVRDFQRLEGASPSDYRRRAESRGAESASAGPASLAT